VKVGESKNSNQTITRWDFVEGLMVSLTEVSAVEVKVNSIKRPFKTKLLNKGLTVILLIFFFSDEANH